MGKVVINAKGIKISACSLVALANAFAACGMKAMPQDLGEAVKKLAAYYNDNQAGDIAQCDQCGGRSPSDLAVCPYCGDCAEVEKPAPAVEDGPAVEETPEPVEAPKAEKKGRTKKAKAEAAPETVVEEAPKATPKAVDPVVVPVNEETGIGGHTPSKKALAKVLPAIENTLGTPAFATAKLDAAVADVQAAKSRGAVAMWDLGVKIAKIYDEALFKSRLDDDGSPSYKGFEAFCAAELGMSHTNAFSLMDVAKAYTSEQVTKLGTTKLSLVLKAPEESREEILGKAANKSVREVADEVKAARKEKGAPAPKSDRKQPHGDMGASARKSKRAEGTIDLPARKLSITLLTESGKPAKRLADEPAGEVVVSEGIALRVSIVVNDDSTLSAVVRFVVTE